MHDVDEVDIKGLARRIQIREIRRSKPHPRIPAFLPFVLRDARKDAGLTQQDLAARIGCGRTQVINIEAGRSGIGIKRFVAWCEVCQVEPAKVLDRALGLEHSDEC